METKLLKAHDFKTIEHVSCGLRIKLIYGVEALQSRGFKTLCKHSEVNGL